MDELAALKSQADHLARFIGDPPEWSRETRGIYQLRGLTLCSVLIEQTRNYPVVCTRLAMGHDTSHQFHPHASIEDIAVWLGLHTVTKLVAWQVKNIERTVPAQTP